MKKKKKKKKEEEEEEKDNYSEGDNKEDKNQVNNED